MLNGASLNSTALNAESGAFTNIVGSGTLFDIEQNVVILGSGSVVGLEQRVGFTGLGVLFDIEQDVLLKLVGSGSVVDLDQTVNTTQSGTFITLEQNVQVSDPLSHFARTGWDATLVIGSVIVAPDTIHGNIRVNRIEGGAALMDVTLIPGLGTQAADLYIGKSVTLDVRTVDGTFRVFTGIIDIPEIDLIEKKITLRCADRREELINDQLGSTISTIGSYSSLIFPETTDINEQLNHRLTTTQEAVDFDAYGNYHITPWAPKATADYTLNDSDVYYSDPKVEFLSRGRLTNKVNIKFGYRYERLHHWERNFSWASPIANNICLALQQGYTWCRKDIVRAAIQSAKWPLKGAITFTQIQDGGWYSCIGGIIAWTTTLLTGTTNVIVDSDGNPVLDSDGNKTYNRRITGGTNLRDIFCNAASWISTFRWAQTVSEDYTLTVQAPQSQTQYGDVEIDASYSAQAEFDTREWENYLHYADNSVFTNTYFIEADENRSAFNNAVSVALNIGKTTILSGHRETRVTTHRRIWPEIDLKHTVLVNTTPVIAKGKVFNITHDLNIGTGEARTETKIALYQSQGSQSDSTLTVPTFSTDTVTLPTDTVTLGNHFGVDPDTVAGSESWTGFIANSFVSGSFFPSNFVPRFVVDTPEIPSYVRNERPRSTSATYNVSIPNDTFTITF